MAPKDSCLTRTSRQLKTASATVFLVEELGDARLRCDQLLRYLNEAVELINKSSHKDHFFEVAGHLITEVPQVAFKLQKSLDAVALAVDRIDYEEIKQGLRPEKVEELERVLKDVHIRQVTPLGDEMTPKQAAAKLREIVKTAREEGSVPTLELARLVKALDPKTKVASTAVPLEDRLEKLAAVLETPLTEGKHSRTKLAAVLRSMMAESELQAVTKVASQKQAFSATDEAIGGLFDEVRGFAIASARAANVHRWRPALLNLYYIVDTIGTILVRLGSMDTAKSEGLKREIRQMLPQAAKAIEESSSYSVMARHEEGKPSDPTKDMSPDDAAKWKDMNEEHGDKFKAACESEDGKMGCGDEPKMGKFEEGESADPTKNMSPEDAAKWKIEHNKNKDNFKEAGEGTWSETFEDNWALKVKTDEGEYVFTVRPFGGAGTTLYRLTASTPNKRLLKYNRQLPDIKKMKSIGKAFADSLKTPSGGVDFTKEWSKLACAPLSAEEEAKRSRFEQNKPADPTKMMDPEAAEDWKQNTEEFGDKFKDDAGEKDAYDFSGGF